MPKQKENNKEENLAEVNDYRDIPYVLENIYKKIKFLESVYQKAGMKDDKHSMDFVKKHAEELEYLSVSLLGRNSEDPVIGMFGEYNSVRDTHKRQCWAYMIYERLNNGILTRIYNDLSPEDKEIFGDPKELTDSMRQVCLFEKKMNVQKYREFSSMMQTTGFSDIYKEADEKYRVPKNVRKVLQNTTSAGLGKILDKNWNSELLSQHFTMTEYLFDNIKASYESKEFIRMKEKLHSVVELIHRYNEEKETGRRTDGELYSIILPELCELNNLAHDYMHHARSSSLSLFSDKVPREKKMIATEKLIGTLNGLMLKAPAADAGIEKCRVQDYARGGKEIRKPAYKMNFDETTGEASVGLTSSSGTYLMYAIRSTDARVLQNRMNLEFIDPETSAWDEKQRESFCCDLIMNGVLKKAVQDKEYDHPLLHSMFKDGGNIDSARAMVKKTDVYKKLISKVESPKMFLKIAYSSSQCKALTSEAEKDFADAERAKFHVVEDEMEYTNQKPKENIPEPGDGQIRI